MPTKRRYSKVCANPNCPLPGGQFMATVQSFERVYCSPRCKRTVENAKYYEQHPDEAKARTRASRAQRGKGAGEAEPEPEPEQRNSFRIYLAMPRAALVALAAETEAVIQRQEAVARGEIDESLRRASEAFGESLAPWAAGLAEANRRELALMHMALAWMERAE